MKNYFLAGTALVALLGAPLAAQDNRMGLSINLAVPTGGFAGTSYAPDAFTVSSSRESYNTGVGAQFTVSFPVDKTFALRLNLGGQSFSGRASAPGYYDLNLQQQMFSLGGEAQFFLADGNAFRQSGTYLLAGVALDFERFDASYGDPNYDASNSVNKTRVGGVIGIGHTWRRGGGFRYLIEGAYHKTLTQTDTAAGDPPGSDFLRFSFGVIL
jgi:hypothetical protein